jgi:hypothetical protein
MTTTERADRFSHANDLLVPENLRMRLETAEPPGAEIVVCECQECLDPGDATAGRLSHAQSGCRNRLRDKCL